MEILSLVPSKAKQLLFPITVKGKRVNKLIWFKRTGVGPQNRRSSVPGGSPGTAAKA